MQASSTTGTDSNGTIVWPLTYRPLNTIVARTLLSWRYDSPYNFYNLANGASDENELSVLTDPANAYFAVIDATGTLVAHRCFGPEAQVPGGDYDEAALDTGGGLRPDLTGRGLGPRVIADGLRFGARLFRPPAFRITVAGFNARALRACESLGFVPTASFTRRRDGTLFRVLVQRNIDLGRT